MDSRRAGLASKPDHWLRVRPGTDAALALSLTHVMIEHGWFDGDFVRRWTNAPLLVRTDTGRLLRAGELSPAGDPAHYVAWDEVGERPVAYDPARGRHAVDETQLALFGVRGLVNFGANLVMAHGDSARGRDALAALDFFVHADLFMNPTAEQADLVLPVTSAFEAEGLKIGFEINEAAQSLVQLRRPLVPPRGEARSDLQIIFALATRLGLGKHFWNGDLDAAFRHQLAPSGLTLEQLRAEPAGVRVPLTTRHHKHAELDGEAPRGFSTPSRKIELYSEVLLEHGYPPLPQFEEPRTSPRSLPELAERFPLILTCAKSLWFCETQHRNVASLRSRARPAARAASRHRAAALRYARRSATSHCWVRRNTRTHLTRLTSSRVQEDADKRVRLIAETINGTRPDPGGRNYARVHELPPEWLDVLLHALAPTNAAVPAPAQAVSTGGPDDSTVNVPAPQAVASAAGQLSGLLPDRPAPAWGWKGVDGKHPAVIVPLAVSRGPRRRRSVGRAAHHQTCDRSPRES